MNYYAFPCHSPCIHLSLTMYSPVTHYVFICHSPLGGGSEFRFLCEFLVGGSDRERQRVGDKVGVIFGLWHRLWSNVDEKVDEILHDTNFVS